MTKINPARLSASLIVVTALLVTMPAWAKKQVAECAVSDREIGQAIKRSKKLMSVYADRMEEEMGVEDQYGVSLAVSVCGREVWNAAYGYADIENSVPVTVDTKFRVGSVSKTMTSIALGQLVESGQLDLDAQIQTYVPTFPRKAFPVTVRQVAGHIAGIRHYNNDEFLSTVHYDSVAEGLSIFENDPLLHEPGSKYEYSTYGWNLLSAVVEGASGEAFLDYMQENVFEAADMSDTLADLNRNIIPHRTEFYHFDVASGANVNAPYVDLSNKWAGGGFLSTPSDLLKFGQATMDGTLVSPQTFDVLTQSQSLSDGEATNYGMGWVSDARPREINRSGNVFDEETVARIAEIVEDDLITGHSGGSVGGLTLFLIAPESRGQVIVAGTSNNGAGVLFPSFVLPVMAEFLAD